MYKTIPVVSAQRYATRVAGLMGALLACAVGLAATTAYEYDSLGRLRKVTHDDGTQTNYALDPAGNRTQIDDVLAQSAPASISVPTGSATGSYTVSWGATSALIGTYELYESTHSGFTAQTRVYSGSGLSASISGKSNDTTYYYRVRACKGSPCTAWRTGANGVLVAIPPSAPISDTLPWVNGSTISFCAGQFASTNATFSFTISGGSQMVTVSPSNTIYTVTNTGWTSGATLGPGTYSMKIAGRFSPSGFSPITITFAGTGHSSTATIRTYEKAVCP